MSSGALFLFIPHVRDDGRTDRVRHRCHRTGAGSSLLSLLVLHTRLEFSLFTTGILLALDEMKPACYGAVVTLSISILPYSPSQSLHLSTRLVSMIRDVSNKI